MVRNKEGYISKMRLVLKRGLLPMGARNQKLKLHQKIVASGSSQVGSAALHSRDIILQQILIRPFKTALCALGASEYDNNMRVSSAMSGGLRSIRIFCVRRAPVSSQSFTTSCAPAKDPNVERNCNGDITLDEDDSELERPILLKKFERWYPKRQLRILDLEAPDLNLPEWSQRFQVNPYGMNGVLALYPALKIAN